MGAMDNLRNNLGASSTRSKLLLVCLVCDVLFLIFMATSAAGPLANQNIYWGKYANADIPSVQADGDVLTGIWGNCIVFTTGALSGTSNCARWIDSPGFVAAYGSAYWNGIAAMQVLAGSFAFFGCVMVAFTFNPAPLLASGVACTLTYIPCFAMMQWANTDMARLLTPYSSYSNGPALGLGATALALTCLSLVLKVLSTRASTAERFADEQGQPMKAVV